MGVQWHLRLQMKLLDFGMSLGAQQKHAKPHQRHIMSPLLISPVFVEDDDLCYSCKPELQHLSIFFEVAIS
jgi:hypothetical protein